MITQPVTTKWIDAATALTRLCRTGGDRQIMKASLAGNLRDGLLRSNARATWISDEVTLKAAFEMPEENESLQLDVDIPVNYWRIDRRLTHDRDEWRWPKSDFFHTIRLKPVRRRIMKGVSLHEDDLARHYSRAFSLTKRRAGRPPDIEKVDNTWTVVVEMALMGCLSLENFNSIGKLNHEILRRLEAKNVSAIPGGNSVQQVASLAFTIMQEQGGDLQES